MDGNRTEERGKAPAGEERFQPKGRPWTERFQGPIRYCRYDGLDAGGRPSIFFKFDLPDGSSDLHQAVYGIVRELKELKREDGSTYATGLTFNRDRDHGRIWKIRDDHTGRTVAAVIDTKLEALARSLAEGRGR